MRILDKNNIEVKEPDYTKGYLINDSLLKCHHEAVEAVEEVGHFETVKEYENGGKDVKWVVDIPAVEPKDAWDEYEEIQRFIEYTEEEFAKIEFAESRRQLTTDEVTTIFMKAQINTVEIDDHTSLRMMNYYPTFEEVIGQTVKMGFKFTYCDEMYKTIQPELMIQEHYKPSEGTESLYTKIDLERTGAAYDPIPYSGNMALENGKYYTQYDVLYLCNRDTVNPVYHDLKELVGLYVESV